MNDIPEQSAIEEPPTEATADGAGLSRRDFAKVMAILTGSTLLMLSRCSLPFAERGGDLPPIPTDFKRFLLVRQSPTTASDLIVTALGHQCPDLKCALWSVEDQEFQFFNSVDQIQRRYTRDGRYQLLWVD